MMLCSHRCRRRSGGFAIPSMWSDFLAEGTEVLVVSSPRGVSFMPVSGKLKIKRPPHVRLTRVRIEDGCIPVPKEWLNRAGLATGAILEGHGMTVNIVPTYAWRRLPNRPPLSCR